MFETVEIPFKTVGNRQILTSTQCVQDDFVMQFIEAFPACFEYDHHWDCYIFYPDGDSPEPISVVNK